VSVYVCVCGHVVAYFFGRVYVYVSYGDVTYAVVCAYA
jgi:hypothetical protein